VDRNDFGANADAQRVLDRIGLDMDAALGAHASTSVATQSTTLHGATLHPTGCVPSPSDLTGCYFPDLVGGCWDENVPGTSRTCKELVIQASQQVVSTHDPEVTIATNENLETIGDRACWRCAMDQELHPPRRE
jgi:hypothetical protein